VAAKLGFLYGILSLFLLGFGIKTLIDAHGKTAPIPITIEEFRRTHPAPGWYTITGAWADVTGSVYWEENGVVIDVYAPLSNVKNGSKSDIYVELTDSKTLSAFIDMGYARKKGGESAAREFRQAHRDVFRQQRDFSGLVTVGVRDPMGEWSKLGIDATNVIMIEDGWKPGTTKGVVCTLIGGLSALFCFGVLVRARRQG